MFNKVVQFLGICIDIVLHSFYVVGIIFGTMIERADTYTRSLWVRSNSMYVDCAFMKLSPSPKCPDSLLSIILLFHASLCLDQW